MNARSAAFFALAAALHAGSACSERTRQDPRPDGAKPVVAAVNEPLAYFARRIAGDSVIVRFDAPGDTDPAFWRPTPSDIRAMQEADLILLNGAGYAQWTRTASLPLGRSINSSTDFADRYIELQHDVTHSHGPGGTHSHADTAFTTWLDLNQATLQAQAIGEALATLLPDREPAIRQSADALAADLESLDRRMTSVGSALGQTPLVGSHPVYQYLARRYELNMRSVHWEPDIVPDEQALAELDALLAQHPARVMIWEDEPHPATEDLLADRGIKAIVFDPCANRPDTGSFLDVMTANVSRLEQAASSLNP